MNNEQGYSQVLWQFFDKPRNISYFLEQHSESIVPLLDPAYFKGAQLVQEYVIEAEVELYL